MVRLMRQTAVRLMGQPQSASPRTLLMEHLRLIHSPETAIRLTTTLPMPRALPMVDLRTRVHRAPLVDLMTSARAPAIMSMMTAMTSLPIAAAR